MRKSFLGYSLAWAICLGLFNLIVFISPNEAGGMYKFDGSFWVGYIFITIAFFGHLACACVTFSARKLKKMFYNIPLVAISYTGLVLMLVAGIACMAIPNLPKWVGIIACMLVIAFNAIAIIKAKTAAELVSNINDKIQKQTFFIKNLAADAQVLMTSSKSDVLRAEAKKVYEAIRYSDPVSDDNLNEIDTRIQRQFNDFSNAVRADDVALAIENAEALLQVIEHRNQMCKMTK